MSAPELRPLSRNDGHSNLPLPGWLPPLALVLLTLAVYANSFPGIFIQDDLHIITSNPLVQNFEILKIFYSDYWYGIENSGLYRPLTVFSLALNRYLTGPSPCGFHLVNVLLHAGVTIFIWLILRRWGLSQRGAFFAAALFAVHPIHIEVVDIVVGRSELLVAFFLLAALFFSRTAGRGADAAVLGAFALALFSKEHAVVFVGILPLCEAFVARSFAVWKRRWRLYVGLFAIVVCWFLLREFVVVHQGMRSKYSAIVVPLAYLPWYQRVLTALCYQGVYLLKHLLAWDLQAAYPQTDLPAIIDRVWSLRGVTVLTVTAGVLYNVVRGLRRWQLWAFLACCYIVAVTPTSNIFMAIGVTFAERLAYFPSVWFCAGCGLFVDYGLRQQRLQNIFKVLVIIWLVGFATVTVMRNHDFQNEIELWSLEVKKNPDDYIALFNFAEKLNAVRRYDEAERVYRLLLQKHPDFPGVLRSYTAFLVTQGRYSDAIVPASHVLQLSKEQADSTGIAYDINSLAEIYLHLEEFDKALEILRGPGAGVLEDKNFYHFLLGLAYEETGDYQRAVESYGQVNTYYKDPKFQLHFGLSQLMLGHLDEAKARLRESNSLNESAEAWNMIGSIDARQERYAEAAEAFARAVALEPENRFYRENLERARTLIERAR